jgi:ferredoxin-thioredoxin reductase catalytic subunit
MAKAKVVLNPDKAVVADVRAGVKARGGYCPCLVEKSEDTKCPCKKFREEQECCCGLYVKEQTE